MENFVDEQMASTLVADDLHCDGIPSRLTGIKVGDRVMFRSNRIIDYVRNHGDIRCGWNDNMYFLCGQVRTITPEIMACINDNHRSIWVEDGQWSVSLDMLEFATLEIEERCRCEEYSIVRDSKDKFVIKEMIEKVDKIRFKKLLAIGMNKDDKSFKDLSDEVVNKYLDLWANAKYEFYLLFGNELKLEKEIEVNADILDIENKVKELKFKFPKYCHLFNSFRMSEWKNNSTEGDSDLETYFPQYSMGMKVTKLLAELCNDKKLNDAVATMLSNQKIKAKIAISIDPYDYLTMSLNNYDWVSCQKIGEGSYSTGALSTTIDESTLVAYKYSGEEQSFNYKNFKFSGNSKSWRECVYFDKNTCSAIFSREYPASIEVISKLIREMLEENVCSFIKKDNMWNVIANTHRGYVSASALLYHDVTHGHNHKMIILKEAREKVETKFEVGKDITCLICGRVIDDNADSFLCDNCQN